MFFGTVFLLIKPTDLARCGAELSSAKTSWTISASAVISSRREVILKMFERHLYCLLKSWLKFI